VLAFIAVLLSVEWLQRGKQFGLQLSSQGLFRYRAVRWSIYYALFVSIILWGGTQEEFIYFQF